MRMTAGPSNNTLTCASGILAPTWHAWARDPCIVCLTSGEAIPQHPAPPRGEIPSRSSFHRVYPPPEGLPRLGFVLQWPLVSLFMPAKWGAHPGSFRGLVSNHPFVWGKALPTPNPMTHEDDGRASKQHLDLCFWNPGPHMACMGQGPLHCVSDIRGGDSPASSPLGGNPPLKAVFPEFLHHQRACPG